MSSEVINTPIEYVPPSGGNPEIEVTKPAQHHVSSTGLKQTVVKVRKGKEHFTLSPCVRHLNIFLVVFMRII